MHILNTVGYELLDVRYKLHDGLRISLHEFFHKLLKGEKKNEINFSIN